MITVSHIKSVEFLSVSLVLTDDVAILRAIFPVYC